MLKKPSSWLFLDAFYLKKLGKEVKENGDDYRKKYGGCYRKVEGEVLLFYDYISGQPPHEGDEKPEDYQHYSDYDKNTAKLRHATPLLSCPSPWPDTSKQG